MVMWIEPWQPLPSALRAMDEPNGLVAATRSLSPRRLLEAYRKGLFPWYSEGQPVLWWSPNPRMVAHPDRFAPRRSLRKKLRSIARAGDWRIVLDGDFRQVMEACAAPRHDGAGTWITPAVIDAYVGLHRLGHAHSFEVRDRDDTLLAGLYGVAIGRMFFGESMFTRVPDGSKCAYAAMMLALRTLEVPMVDCQQSTGHLESLGATELSRDSFLDRVAWLVRQPMPDWAGLEVRWPVDDSEVDDARATAPTDNGSRADDAQSSDGLLADASRTTASRPADSRTTAFRPADSRTTDSPKAPRVDSLAAGFPTADSPTGLPLTAEAHAERLEPAPDPLSTAGPDARLNVAPPGSPRVSSPDASASPPADPARDVAADASRAATADPSRPAAVAPSGAASSGQPAHGVSDREP